MEQLREMLVGNADVEYVLAQIKQRYKSYQRDIIRAYDLVCEWTPMLTDSVKRRFEAAALAFRYMEPTPEDIVTILLFPGYRLNRVTPHTFLRRFSEPRVDHYVQYIADAYKNESNHVDEASEEEILYRILMRICDKMFRRMMRTVNSSDMSNTVWISSAYETVRKLYYGVNDATGVPYMVRPVRIASVLVNSGVDSTVIAASLLRDAVDDAKLTLDGICQEFGRKITDCVSAVAMLERGFADAHVPSRFQHGELELSDASFRQLVRHVEADSDMLAALFIKGADTVYRISMLDTPQSEPTSGAGASGQLDYMPLFEKLELRFFVREIENLTWRAADVERYDRMLTRYEELIARNWPHLDALVKTLSSKDFSDVLNGVAGLCNSHGYEIAVKKRRLLPYDLYRCISEKETPLKDPAPQINKRTVPLCDMDIVLRPLDERATYDLFTACFLKTFDSKIASTGTAVSDLKADEDGNVILTVEDRYRNTYRCRIIKRGDYDAQQSGTGRDEEDEFFEPCEGKGTEMIDVYLRNKRKIRLPKGSTVIDVAFAIHEEIGYTVRSATINERRVSIFNRLSDGDHVIVEADTFRMDGVTKKFIHHCRINWIAHVATERARKKLIAFLSDYHEGDDPRYETVATNSAVETIADGILENWHPVQ